MAPAVIDTTGEGDVYKRAPLRSFRLLEQIHSCLVREFVSLAGVAGNTGTDDIFPSSLTSTIAGQDMVDIEMAPVKMFAAVLAGILIPLKNIVPRELDLFFWQTVKETKNDDSWYPDVE